MNRSVTFIKYSSSSSVSLCSQIYCTENGDMRGTVSIFSFGYRAPHEAPQGERSSLWEEHITWEPLWPLLMVCSRKFQGCKHPWTFSIVLEYLVVSLKPQRLWSYENLSFFFLSAEFYCWKLKSLSYKDGELGLIKRKSESITFKTPRCVRVLTL